MPDDSLSLSDTPSYSDILKAQIDALRRQSNPADLQTQTSQGMLLAGARNSGLQNMGDRMIGNAQQRGAELQPGLAQARETLEGGPQAALGGATPKAFQLLTARAQVPKFASDIFGRYNVRTGAPAEGGGNMIDSLLSPEAIDQNAALYNQTGKLPQMGRANGIVHAAILKRAAELLGDRSLAGNQAGYGADKGSLASLQKQADSVDAFERTSLGNLSNFLSIADKVPDVGIPFLNKPLRSLDDKLLGSPDMAAFGAARQVAVNEIAKVLNNPGAGGQAVSDSARGEIQHLIGPDATLEQIKRAAAVLVNDMKTRKASIAAQLSEVRGRIGGGTAPAGAVPAPASGAPAAARPRRTVNGETREWDGRAWVPVNG